MNQELRLYTFCNFYLSSIQQGIQSAHVVHSLFIKYPAAEINPILWDWAENDKTMIVLNGGAHADISQGYSLAESLSLTHRGVPLPLEYFREDDYSLGGILTCWGIVLPKCIYDAKYDRESDSYVYVDELYTMTYAPGTAGHEFLKMLKSCGLAR